MKVIIESVPYKDMRYPTIGDWYTDKDGVDHILVAEEIKGTASKIAVAIHEWIEQYLCGLHGVTGEKVTEHDLLFEKEREQGLHEKWDEPGEDKRAPYYDEHAKAIIVEMITIACLDLDWHKHEKNCQAAET